MAEHDPLPWHCSRIIRETGRDAGCDIGAANGANVALVHYDPDDSTTRETWANACYIVTAANAFPELVEACQAFVELFRDSDMRPEDECHELYATMKAALKTAGVADG